MITNFLCRHGRLLTLSALVLMSAVVQQARAVEPMVVSGYQFSLYLDADGTVWSWGDNSQGQLGTGNTTSRTTAGRIPELSKVIAISAGYEYALAVKSNGTVWGWGANGNGQLGIGNTTNQLSPVQVTITGQAKAVAAGRFHSLILNTAGNIYSWGCNDFGELGNGTTISSNTPQLVTGGFTKYRAIAVGEFHSVAITQTGTVQAWGYDLFGQLGDDSTIANKSSPVTVSGITNAATIAAGYNHNVVTLANGNVSTWGYNGVGQIGNGTYGNQPTPIEIPAAATRAICGANSSGYLQVEGYVVMWGDNTYGQCFTPTTTSNVAKPSYLGPFSLNFRCTGSSMGNHFLYVADNGTVHGWGNNSAGQLGNGVSGGISTTDVTATTNWPLDAITAIDAGNSHSIALKADGTVWTWGLDSDGELGDDVTPANKSTPVQVFGLSGVIAIAAGSYHNLALLGNGNVYSWGQNTNGQLGDSSLVNKFIPVKVNIIHCTNIAAGGYYSMAVVSDGTVQSWGSNTYGQLGDGTTVNKAIPDTVSKLSNIIELDAGFAHSIARKADGSIATWGYNLFGALGNGGTANSSTPVNPVLSSVVSIAAGCYHTAATTADGNMYAWGNDGNGQLGNDVTISNKTSPTSVPSSVERKRVSMGPTGFHTLVLLGNGNVVSAGYDGLGQLGNDSSFVDQPTLVSVSGIGDIAQIASGDLHSLALRSDGVVFAWGNDGSGQLGDDVSLVNKPTPVQTAKSWLPVIQVSSTSAASEPSVDGSLAFTRTLVNEGSVAVRYGVSGTAIEGTTYQNLPASGAALISSGKSGVKVIIDPIDNDVDSDDTKVVLTAQTDSGYLLGAAGTEYGSVTISDNDTANIILSSTNVGAPVSISSITTTEAGGTYLIYVKLNSQPAGGATVTIPFTSSNTAEGVVSPSSLVFNNTDWNTYKTVTVTGVNDLQVDGNISYTITKGLATSGDSLYAAISPTVINATNNDNDMAGVTIVNSMGTLTEAAGSSRTGTYTLVLTSQPPSGNNVTISVTPNSQITVSPSSLIFTNANWNSAQTVTVTVVDDAISEASPHTGLITHSAAGGGYGSVSIANVSPKITDNDNPGYVITRTSATTGTPIRLITTEALGQGTFTIALATQPSGSVTIPIASSLLTEGTVSPASVVFQTNNWSTAQVVTVTGVDDPTDDGDKSYNIALSSPTSTDTNYSSIGQTLILMSNQDNDTAAVLVDRTSVITSETGGPIPTGTGTSDTISVTLQCQPTANVVITVSSNYAFAANEHTVSPITKTFTPVNWNVAQAFTVTGVNDATVDSPTPYNIIFTASGATEYSSKAATVSVLNQDDDVAGVQVSTSALTVTEASGTNHAKTYTVRLNTSPAGAGTLVIAFTSGTTSAVTISPSSMTFDAGNFSDGQTITVTGVNDDIDQSINATSLITGSITTATASYSNILTPVPSVTVTVTDNDVAAVIFTSTLLQTTESGSSTTLGIRLASEPSAAVAVTLAGLNTLEGTLSTSVVNFTTTNWATQQNVTITGVNDAIDDGNISYVLTGTASGAAEYVGLTNAVSVTNTDDDTVGVEVLNSSDVLLTSALTTTELGGTAVFHMRLTSQPTQDVVINLLSSDTSEGTISPSSLTFTSGNWNIASSHVVTVTGLSDVQADDDVSYSIITETASSTDVLYQGLNAADVDVVNTDNTTLNRAGITITPTTLTVTEATAPTVGVHSDAFTVILDSQPSGNVTIFLASTNTNEATVSPAVLTFSSGTWNVAQTVTVTGVDDLISDGPQSLFITTIAASGDANYNVGDAGVTDVSVTTTSTDDVPALVVTPSTLITTETVGGNQDETFTIALATQPTGPVTVSFTFLPAPSDGTEGTIGATTVAFTTTNWFVSQLVTVSGIDDDRDDNDQSYQIIATASGGEYAGVTTTINVTNQDDDSVGVTVTPKAGLVTTEASDAANSATFTLRLTSEPLGDVTINLVSDNTAEGTVAPSSVTFTTANWSTPQSIAITGVDDSATDGDIGYSIVTTASSTADPAYDGLAVDDVSVTNQDDETTNLNPVAVAQTYSTVVNVDIDDFLSGSDAESVNVTYEIGTPPSQGTLTLVSATTGAFNFVVPPNTRGDYTFTFRVNDGTGRYSSYTTCTLHISGGDDVRPYVLVAPPMESENGPQTCVVQMDPTSKAGTTPFTYKVLNVPAGITVTVQALASPTNFQVNYQINDGTLGDHFTFDILIIDHDRPAATLLKAMIQRVTPLGPG